MGTPFPAIYGAAPPEVHSTLLSTGATAAGIVAAGLSWAQLAANYTAALAELDEILMAVQANYRGPSAEAFVAAHLPMLLWLASVAVKATDAGATHADVAAAYETALATMPTMPELIANHALEALLIATNFFGCNTVPIALTQADYVRMWILAADVMAGWDGSSTALVGLILETPPSPITLLPGVGEAGSAAATAMGFGTQGEAGIGGAALNTATLVSTKLAVGKAASSPASVFNRVPGPEVANDAAGDKMLGDTPETMGGNLLQQGGSMLSSVPSMLSSVAQAPAQLLTSAPQTLMSAPQQLGSMLGQFMSAGGSHLASQSTSVPVGFTGTGSLPGFNPAGVTSLAGGALGTSPSRPMLPSTWGTAPTTPESAPANGIRTLAPMSASAAGTGAGTGGGMMGHGANRRNESGQRVKTYVDEEHADEEHAMETSGYRTQP